MSERKRALRAMNEHFIGRRVRLLHTSDEYTRLQPGALGTVGFVDDLGTLHVNWDDGSSLGLVAAAGDRWEEARDDG